jgi:hypothetical protein
MAPWRPSSQLRATTWLYAAAILLRAAFILIVRELNSSGGAG